MAFTKDEIKQLQTLFNNQRKELSGELATTRKQINQEIGDAMAQGFETIGEQINNLRDDMIKRFNKTDERIDRLEKIHPNGKHTTVST